MRSGRADRTGAILTHEREPGAGIPPEVLEHLAEGVLVLAPDLAPTSANGAASRLLGLERGALPRRVPSEEVLSVVRHLVGAPGEVEEVITTWFPERRTIKVRASTLREGGYLVVLEDVTDEQRSQQVRREFVAHASHELKSPVAGLQALAEALIHAATDDPRAVTRFADRIVTESDRLGRLISDLLDLSRLEDPGRAAHDPVDLSALVATEAREQSGAAATKDMSFVAEVAEGLWVSGDEQQLRAMVRNLLENAIRYTPKGREVRIVLAPAGAEVELAVIDNGIGISTEAQGRVFERFYRADRARSRDRGGTGLGLAIVKHVVETHSGTVQVDSTLGEGSTFTVTLPLLRTVAPGLRSAG